MLQVAIRTFCGAIHRFSKVTESSSSGFQQLCFHAELRGEIICQTSPTNVGNKYQKRLSCKTRGLDIQCLATWVVERRCPRRNPRPNPRNREKNPIVAELSPYPGDKADLVPCMLKCRLCRPCCGLDRRYLRRRPKLDVRNRLHRCGPYRHSYLPPVGLQRPQGGGLRRQRLLRGTQRIKPDQRRNSADNGRRF